MESILYSLWDRHSKRLFRSHSSRQTVALALTLLAFLSGTPVWEAQAQLHETKLVAADADTSDFFGEMVAIDGNRVVVGVRTADINGTINTGAAYVFERIDGEWQEVQKLTASNRRERDFFGESAALKGDWLFLGARGNDDREQEGGAVYVFKRIDGQWEQVQILYPSDSQDFHGFSWEIALQGDRVFIGAPQDEDVAIQAGAVYVFELKDGEWVERQKIKPTSGISSFFGTTIGVDGDHLIIGSPTDDTVADGAGAAYVFELQNGQWQRVDQLLPPPVALPDSLEFDTFAREVALNGDWAFVGSFDDEVCNSKPLFEPNNPNSCVSGAVFAYQRQSDGDWEFQQKIAPEELEQFDYFGALSIAIEDYRVVVGSRGDDDACPDPPPPNPLFCDTGAAYVFDLVNGEWKKVDKLTASDADSLDFLGGTIFGQGRTVGISGSHIIAGAPTVPFGLNPNPNFGAAYIFKMFNQEPVARDDSMATPSNTAVEIDILANDHDADYDLLTPTITEQPTNGEVAINTGGGKDSPFTITYTPNNGFGGTDTFTYEIGDGDGGTATATVTIAVGSPPTAPVIASPGDEAEVLIGGTDQNPGDPDEAFEVTWSASTDPDGGTLHYTWELASTEQFTELLLQVDAGSETRIETDYGTLGALLRDNNVLPGMAATFYHRAVATDGGFTTPGPASQVRLIRGVLTATEEEAEVPDRPILFSNYPNPFNPETRIAFSLPHADAIRLSVFDVQGREVVVLLAASLPAGRHEVVFSAGDLPSGIYIYQLATSGQMLRQKMLLLK